MSYAPNTLGWFLALEKAKPGGGLRLSDLARRAGIHLTTAYALLHGHRMPSTRAARGLLQASGGLITSFPLASGDAEHRSD